MKIIRQEKFIVENYQEQLEKGLLYEMANISKNDTHLPYDIWIDSVGVRRNTTHNLPRLKVLFDGNLIPILIDSTNPEIPVSAQKQLGFNKISKQREIESWIIKNYDILIKHWNNELTDRETLNMLYERDNPNKKS